MNLSLRVPGNLTISQSRNHGNPFLYRNTADAVRIYYYLLTGRNGLFFSFFFPLKIPLLFFRAAYIPRALVFAVRVRGPREIGNFTGYRIIFVVQTKQWTFLLPFRRRRRIFETAPMILMGARDGKQTDDGPWLRQRRRKRLYARNSRVPDKIRVHPRVLTIPEIRT